MGRVNPPCGTSVQVMTKRPRCTAITGASAEESTDWSTLSTPLVKTAPPVCCIRHDFSDRRLAGGVVVGSWRAARGRRLCGQGLLPVGLPGPGQEFVQTDLRQVGNTVEDIGEPGLRVDVVELRGADERVQDSAARTAPRSTNVESKSHRTCAVLVLNPPEFIKPVGFKATLRRVVSSNTFAQTFDDYRWAHFYTPDDQIGRLVPIGKRKSSGKQEIVLTDRNGDRHNCIAESFTQKRQVFVLIHVVNSLGQSKIIIPAA